MQNNKLIIAAAGSGKTTFLVNEALNKNSESVLITTFTEANESEIRNRIIGIKGFIPTNIKVQTWFSFLLQHGVRPFQSILNGDIHDANIGFCLVSEKSGAKINSEGKQVILNGNPIYWGEKDFLKFYFNRNYNIYSDKISKFVCDSNEASDGAVISRVSRVFDHIFIDEVQDLAGYDLEILKLLFKSESSLVVVGDPRQVTYLTHHSRKFAKYADGKIKSYVQNELGKKIICEIDETTLSTSHRNNQLVCDYSAKLFPDFPKSKACNCIECQVCDIHLGVFMIKPSEVDKYLEKYNPVQLRWSATKKVNGNYSVQNFGESKGVTMNRVLIYPTEPMKAWIRDNQFKLTIEARAKFYVSLTRSRLSSTIVMEYNDDDHFDGVKYYTFDEERKNL